jgi:dTDP-4-dehydrorhamnose 3,5-epimerase
MRIEALSLPGAFIIEPEPIADERGFFARTFCERTFAERGLNPSLAQCSISFNRRKGTLRGMHYQRAPHQEDKLVRCTMGAIYDVVLDLRPESPTWGRWAGVELSADNRKAVYIPKGCAHGFLTLADDSEVFYQISEPFQPQSAAGLRWNDPSFAIAWPAEVRIIADRDRAYPDYTLQAQAV